MVASSSETDVYEERMVPDGHKVTLTLRTSNISKILHKVFFGRCCTLACHPNCKIIHISCIHHRS